MRERFRNGKKLERCGKPFDLQAEERKQSLARANGIKLARQLLQDLSISNQRNRLIKQVINGRDWDSMETALSSMASYQQAHSYAEQQGLSISVGRYLDAGFIAGRNVEWGAAFDASDPVGKQPYKTTAYTAGGVSVETGFVVGFWDVPNENFACPSVGSAHSVGAVGVALWWADAYKDDFLGFTVSLALGVGLEGFEKNFAETSLR